MIYLHFESYLDNRSRITALFAATHVEAAVQEPPPTKTVALTSSRHASQHKLSVETLKTASLDLPPVTPIKPKALIVQPAPLVPITNTVQAEPFTKRKALPKLPTAPVSKREALGFRPVDVALDLYSRGPGKATVPITPMFDSSCCVFSCAYSMLRPRQALPSPPRSLSANLPSKISLSSPHPTAFSPFTEFKSRPRSLYESRIRFISPEPDPIWL